MGKLVGLNEPHVALVTRGEVSADWRRHEGRTGWTVVSRSNVGDPTPERFADLYVVLAALREG